MAKLGELCKIQSGGTPSRSNPKYWEDGQIPWVKISDIKSKYLDGTEEYITESGLKNSSAKIFPAGTILYTIFATLGETCILNIDAATNQAIAGIQVESDLILPNYLYYYLLSQKANVAVLGRGVAQNNINMKMLRDFEVPLPTLDQQRHIAAVLDKVTDLIAQRRAQLDKLDLLVEARFNEMFGDSILNPKRFPVYKMKDIVQFEGGSQPDKKFFEYAPTENNVRLIQIRDYKSDKFITYIPKALARRFCTADDIMIGRYGPPIFQILGGIDGAYNVALMKATPKMGNREFIRHFLKQKCLLHYLEGLSKRTAGQDGIQMDKLKEYPVPYPPVELQNEFERTVSSIKLVKSTIGRSLKGLEMLKKKLLQDYYT